MTKRGNWKIEFVKNIEKRHQTASVNRCELLQVTKFLFKFFISFLRYLR